MTRMQEAVRIGDRLQSEASRLAEFVRRQDQARVPYETQMAAIEVETAVEEWTQLRRRWVVCPETGVGV
jgi:hypothetical protein